MFVVRPAKNCVEFKALVRHAVVDGGHSSMETALTAAAVAAITDACIRLVLVPRPFHCKVVMSGDIVKSRT